MATLEALEKMLRDIEDAVARVAVKTDRISAKSINAPGGLSDISASLGVVSSGELRQGNGLAIGSGFSGVRIVYPSVNYGGVYYNVAGVWDDVLQFGLVAETGEAYIAGGLVILNEDGINIELGSATANRLSWIGSSNEEQGWIYTSTLGDSTSAHMFIDVGHDSADYGRTDSSLTLRSWVENGSNQMEYTALELHGDYTALNLWVDLYHYNVTAAAGVPIMTVYNSGGVIFNEDGVADMDFTVETDTYNAVFIDASNNSIMVMSNAAGKVGFYGIAAVAQQVLATTGSAANIIALLQLLGLCRES